MRESKQAAPYDYVVVGSGPGGGPVAVNLAKAGFRVLLLEAGGEDENWNYQVPAFHGYAVEDEALRWDFFVRHYGDDTQQQRDPKFTPGKNGVLYPRAGTLGGCSAHNAMITVYPHNSDWDAIAQSTGDKSWRARHMRKYFQRLEDNHCHPVWRRIARWFGVNPGRFGFRGWLPSSIPNPGKALLRDAQLLELFKDSAVTALKALDHPLERLKQGIQGLFDPNDWRLVKQSAQGLRYPPLAIRHGRRVGTREHLNAARQQYPERLVVKTHCLVTKVILDDANRAIGVEYLQGRHLYRADPRASRHDAGVPQTVRVTREIILAGGAFNTPQLLKLSGIGPRAELERHGIPVVVDLPGVGENLQDRYEVCVVNEMREDFTLLAGATFPGPRPGEEPDPVFKQWLEGRGVFTTNGAILAVITKSGASSHPEPDLFIFALAGNFYGYFPGFSVKATRDHRHLSWAVLKAHTHNTAGSVRLASANPRDVPDINFRYFDEGNDASGEDLESVVRGVEFVRQMTAATRELMQEEIMPGPQVRTREQIAQYVQDNAWGHHACGTCKIGPASDPMAVLDSRFRVRGVQHLRVVDASVFPRIPGFFIVSAVYMVSEKASDVIRQDARAMG